MAFISKPPRCGIAQVLAGEQFVPDHLATFLRILIGTSVAPQSNRSSEHEITDCLNTCLFLRFVWVWGCGVVPVAPFGSNQSQQLGAHTMLKNFLRDESGAELVEYAAGAALLVAVALVIYQVLGNGISEANSQTGKEIQDASITINP